MDESLEVWRELEAVAREYLATEREGWEGEMGALLDLYSALGRILERELEDEEGKKKWHGMTPFRCHCGAAIVGAGYGPPGCATSHHVTVTQWVCPACLIRGITGEVIDEE